MDLIFFFQAEDGIRGIGVTGVQTCALPISGLAPPSLVLASTVAFLLSELADLGVYTPLQRRGLILAVAASSVVEIGRASCRERVQISVVAVSLKQIHHSRVDAILSV